jgi:magnesium-transporting ATPase (P-type)
VVLLTGVKTYLGRTIVLVQQARPKFHIDAVMVRVVRWLFLVVGSLLGMVVVLSLIRGTPLLEMAPLMLILFIVHERNTSFAPCHVHGQHGRRVK